MLKDDAIRQGKILPTKNDIERMNLSKSEIKEIESKFGKTMSSDEPVAKPKPRKTKKTE